MGKDLDMHYKTINLLYIEKKYTHWASTKIIQFKLDLCFCLFFTYMHKYDIAQKNFNDIVIQKNTLYIRLCLNICILSNLYFI